MNTMVSHNQKLCGLYQLVKEIDRTSAASVWEVVDDEGRKYAAKIKPFKGPGSRIPFLTEFHVYVELTKGRFRFNKKSDGTTPHGFVNLHFAGIHNREYDVLVMDLLSADLSTLGNENLWNVDFKYNTYLTLGCDMLLAIMTLHEHGFVHRNVKPHNFMLEGSCYPCLLDFTTAKRYIEERTKHHCQQSQELSFTGTLEYASLNAHLLKSQSRRDDLISLGYSIIDMMQKGLPWDSQLTVGKSLAYKSYFIKCGKESTSLEILCSGLPVGVLEYMRLVTALSFDTLPDYFLLHTLLDPRSQEYFTTK